jgi:hypothetical protein
LSNSRSCGYRAESPNSGLKPGGFDAITMHFCPGCGSPLFTTSNPHPAQVYVTAGSLDDPALVEPGLELWTRSRVPWAHMPAGLASYPEGRVGEASG